MSDWVKRFLPFASLVALCVVIAALEPKFLSAGNLAGVARQTAVITIIAMGMTVVMVSGGIDLSVGSEMALAGVAGALLMAAGEGYELRVIAAVVIGGGSLGGGQGGVVGALVGSLIMGVLSNGANLLGISSFTQQIVIGAVIVLAVTFDEFQRRRFESAAG